MFDFFRRHTRVLQFLLVVLIFPSFVFFGIQGYSSSGGGEQRTVATVAGQKISQLEWENDIRERIERARRQMPGIDARMFETPEMRRLALETLVRERVLLVSADKLHLLPSDERLDRMFKSDPEFAQLRNPDGSLNRDVLGSLGMSSEAFAQRLRQDIARRQVLRTMADSVLAPAAAASAAFDALYQQREVEVLRFDARDQLAKVSPGDAEIEAFYNDPANAAQFQAPDQASVEYVVLDLESLQKGIKISEEDLRKHYAENEKRYTAPEERRASHILIKADKDAPRAERDKARERAEALLAEVKKNPASFAEIARKSSQDEGSAEKGGDLDFFARGAMVKPFEDAAFGLKPGEISGVVESDFGYHVIQLVAVRGGEKKSFEAVRAELEAEVRGQLAQKRFTDAAVEFSDTVYEQSDSLKPAAAKWQLEIASAPRILREPLPGAQGALANLKFLEALFAGDATREKRNTKAIDIGSSKLAAGRVVQYTPSRRLPLADVREGIRRQLATRQAAALAKKLGGEKLAAARAAPQVALAASPQVVSRAQPGELSRQLLDAVLNAPATPLPAFVGVELGDQGYAIAKVTKILGRDPAFADAEKAKAQYAQGWAEAEAQAYYAALKVRHKASVDDAALAPRDPASAAR